MVGRVRRQPADRRAGGSRGQAGPERDIRGLRSVGGRRPVLEVVGGLVDPPSGDEAVEGRLAGAQAAPVENFFVAGNASDRGGVRVAVKDADGDGKGDAVVGSGEGSPANARVYLGKNFASAAE